MMARANTMPGGRAGFTLIEVLVATSLLTIGLGTAAFLMASSYGTYRNQNRTLEMNHLVHDQLETLTSTAYEALADDIAKARNPGDPFRPDLPPQRDFEKARATNGVIARFEMVPPPPEKDEYKIIRKGDTPPKDYVVNAGGGKVNHVEVSMKLEYWDPVFDGPADKDKGLIRGTYEIEWGGARDRGVKYFAR